jgi:TonB family protein
MKYIYNLLSLTKTTLLIASRDMKCDNLTGGIKKYGMLGVFSIAMLATNAVAASFSPLPKTLEETSSAEFFPVVSLSDTQNTGALCGQNAEFSPAVCSSDTIADGRVLLTSDVDKLPSFPGGNAKVLEYVVRHLKYPSQARASGQEGKVYLQFIVNEDGTLDSISVMKGISPEMDAEAVRIVKGMPKWRPGILNEKAVKVRYTFPVHFNLADCMWPDEETIEALNKEGILMEADEMPSFPGGERGAAIYVAQNIRYPKEAFQKKLQGKVLVQFVVTESGELSRISIFRSAGKVLDNEALRVIKSMPKWNPGQQGGKPVQVWQVFPVTFLWHNSRAR